MFICAVNSIYFYAHACSHRYNNPPLVPQPGVDVTLSHTAPLYAGTSLTLICTVTLDPNVNNGEMVKTEWSGLQHIPEERYSITGASGSGNNYYIGNLTISPLADQDNGTYTCMVTVTGGSHVQQATASDAVSSIIVNGKFSVCGGYTHSIFHPPQLSQLQ